MSYIIDKACWVVFNPTAEDYENSNETSQSAQKDIEGIRVWLTKSNSEYIYRGEGNYTGGPIINIPPVFMPTEDLVILADSPRWDAATFDTLKELNNNYINSEIAFKDCFLQLLQFQLLVEDGSATSVALAYTALSAVMTAINSLDLDSAYTALNNASLSGSFTATIKANMVSLIKGYLEKYPR